MKGFKAEGRVEKKKKRIRKRTMKSNGSSQSSEEMELQQMQISPSIVFNQIGNFGIIPESFIFNSTLPKGFWAERIASHICNNIETMTPKQED